MSIEQQTSKNLDVSIIIVSWNNHAVLANCLRSLENAKNKATFDVWVVDNASSDGTASLVQSQFPSVNLIANKKNLGFAGANNQAVPQSNGKYILLLNPDTEMHAESIEVMLDEINKDSKIGVLGPRILNPDGTPQRSCWRGYPGLGMAISDAFYLWKFPWLPLTRNVEYRPDELIKTRDVDHLLGAGLLIRRQTWDEIGPLDENFFLFLEETDWCLRAKQAGWRVVFTPNATITHFGQHSMRQQPAKNLPHFYRSYCHFYRKHSQNKVLGTWPLKVVIGMAACVKMLLWGIRYARKISGEQNHAIAMIKGYWQVLTSLPNL